MLDAAEITALVLSLKVAVAATLAGLPLAILLAWWLARYRFPGKIVIELLLYLPLVVPPVVVGFFLIVALGPQTALGRALDLAFTWKAAAVASAVMALPLMIRSIGLAIEAVEPRLEGVARTLGASEARIFFTVTLPLARDGVLAGAVLGFARALAEFGATIAFAANIPGQTQTLPLAVFTALQSPGGEAAALRLSLFAVLLGFAALVLAELLGRKPLRAT